MDAIESNEKPMKEAGGRSTKELEMTDEQSRLYKEHVLKSEGFDVPDMPGVYAFHLIKPYDINEKTEYIDFDRFSQHAIDQYNRRFKKAKAKLEFVKVLKAMVQPANAVMFYITFEAKDIADGGKIKTYQTVVLMKVGWKMSVLSFGLQPPEDEQGSSNGKEWFWQGHLCNGDVFVEFKKVVGDS